MLGATSGADVWLFPLRNLLGAVSAVCSYRCWTLWSLSRNVRTSSKLTQVVLVSISGTVGFLSTIVRGRLGDFVLYVELTLVAGVLRVERREELCVRAGCVGVAVAEAGAGVATDAALAVGHAFVPFSVLSP